MIEGDKFAAEKYLQSFSPDVRFIETKEEEDPYATANHALPNGLILKQCVFSHQLQTKRRVGINDKVLPVDSRYEVVTDHD